MKKSTHRVEVIRLDPFKHPNADTLSIQRVYGYTVCLRSEDWQGIALGAYIVPDSVVDTQRPEFSWLAPDVNKNFRPANGDDDRRFHHVTVMRLRGVISYGLMVPAPEGSSEGDDVSDILGVTRYNQVIVSQDGIEGPDRYKKDYDLEAYERYAADLLIPGEEVIYVEKMDGENGRFCYQDGRLHAGSKNQWIDPIKGQTSSVWRAATKFSQLEVLTKENPELTIYLEIVGYPESNKTKRRYNIPPGDIDIYAFDILRGDTFVDYDEMKQICERYGIKTAPEVARVKYAPEIIHDYIPKKSLVPGVTHEPEGIVCRPVHERYGLQGRAVLKLVAWR